MAMFNRAALLVGVDSIMFLHVGHDVVDEILDELIDRRLAAGPSRAESTARAGMAGRHHDDHGLGVPGGDKIVQDETGATHGGPGFITVPGTVQQVEDGIFAFSGFVAGRGIDVHPSKLAQRF
jgi:hypothetical protein